MSTKSSQQKSRRPRVAEKKLKQASGRPSDKAPVPRKGGGRGYRRQRPRPADKLLTKAGAHGSNNLAIEKREVAQDTYAAVNQDAQLEVSPYTTMSSINMFAIGILLAAKKRGLNVQMDENKQYQALNYMVGVIRSAIQGATLEFTSAPRWFVEILHALRPKSHRAITASAYFEMSVTDNVALSTVYSLGTSDETYNLAFGTAGAPFYNGFPTIFTAYTYNPDEGKEWFSRLWAVFPSVPGTPSEHIPPTLDSPYLKDDCSAFSLVTSRLGTSFFCPGGVNNFLENEVYIQCPILARFCSDNEITDGLPAPFRAGFHYANGGGTACYLGPRCREFTRLSQFRNKARQIFKFYDLYRFYEVFSLLIGGVLERQYKQNAVLPSPYPLTPQRTLIMLRQALLPFFNNEMAQDLRLKNAQDFDPGIEKYLPLTVCDNGVSVTSLSVSPLMPKFFTEMIKGCSRIVANVDKSSTLEESRLVIDWVPVLAIRAGSDYNTYTYQQGESTAPVYQTDPSEVPINLLDCSIVDGSDTYYLSLNGTELQEIINAHNSWMTENQPFMTGLSKLSASEGSPLFSSIISTQYVVPLTQLPQEEVVPATSKRLDRKVSKTKVKGSSLTKARVRKVSPVPSEGGTYENWGAYQLQSNLPFMKELQKYQMLLVPPVFSTQATAGWDDRMIYLQSLYGEYISVAYGSTIISADNINNIPSLYSLHQGAAELDLKNVAGSGMSEIEVVIDQLEKEGQGGFLSILSGVLTTAGKIAGSFDV